MTFAPYLAHTEPIFNSLELLPVEKIFINRVSIVMFKFSCNMLPDPIAKLYSKNKDYHSHNTRNKNHLKVSTGTTNFTSNSARIWNTISTKIDVNVTFVQFKANLKLYLRHTLMLDYKLLEELFMVYRALVCVKVEYLPLYQLTCIKLLYNQY